MCNRIAGLGGDRVLWTVVGFAALAAYGAVLAVLILKGWRSEAIELGAVLPAAALYLLVEKRGACGRGRRRASGSGDQQV